MTQAKKVFESLPNLEHAVLDYSDVYFICYSGKRIGPDIRHEINATVFSTAYDLLEKEDLLKMKLFDTEESKKTSEIIFIFSDNSKLSFSPNTIITEKYERIIAYHVKAV